MSDDDIEAFSAALVRAHNFGTGPFFSAPTVRKALAIRINTALTGHSGCSPQLILAFADLFRCGIIPAVRRHGSIGCADIGLMGQIAAALTGSGEAFYNGMLLPAGEALRQAGLQPLRLRPRDALAALSTNAIAFAATSDVCARRRGRCALPLPPGFSRRWRSGPRPIRGRSRLSSARAARRWPRPGLPGSDGRGWPAPSGVHDPLSLRMTAQVFGAAVDTLLVAAGRIVEATHVSDDNPVVIGNRVMASGASLPLTVALYVETAQIAFSHVARNILNRCIQLTNGVRRNLPVNLVAPGVVATGMGPLMKLVVELYMRVQSLAVPLSAQSIVVAGGLEEEATFLPLIVERMETQVRDLRQMAAIEAMLSAQAIDLTGDAPDGVALLAYERVRATSATYREDRPLSLEIEALDRSFSAEDFLAGLIRLAPMPEFDQCFALSGAIAPVSTGREAG